MVAMSGGVDSSVTAALLKQKGLDVSGVFMMLGQAGAAAQAAKVQKIADFLRVPFTPLNLEAEFSLQVLSYFSKSYLQGKTPNPCMVCNKTIKFGKLLDYALARGMDYLATGHYAETSAGGDGISRLFCGADPKKDQAYFLSRLSQAQLARIVFPLGGTSKTKVYELAAALGLSGLHNSSESQDVCFMDGRSLQEYFADTPHSEAGDFVTIAGEPKGRHSGIWHYTVGQRRGLGIPDATPYYVTGLDAANNRVIIGKDRDLWHKALQIKDINWLSGQAPPLPAAFMVKIRYRHNGAARVRPASVASQLSIEFAKPQRAITPGQFAVLYRDNEVIGSGEIC
jgi:tRNA-specific 2-thiouridylase